MGAYASEETDVIVGVVNLAIDLVHIRVVVDVDGRRTRELVIGGDAVIVSGRQVDDRHLLVNVPLGAIIDEVGQVESRGHRHGLTSAVRCPN